MAHMGPCYTRRQHTEVQVHGPRFFLGSTNQQENQGAVARVLRWCLSKTDANAITGRGDMFVPRCYEGLGFRV